MKLSQLYLNRQLYRADQSTETPNGIFASINNPLPDTAVIAGPNSAYDVNTNTPDISGNKVRTGAVESTQYSYSSGVYSVNGMQINLDNGAIRSVQFGIDASGNAYFKGDISGASGTFSGSITIGTGNSVFKVFPGTGMWLGNTVFASAPFRVDMSGNVTASSLSLTNASIGTGSSYTGNQIAEAYIGNLTASKITSGTIDASVITVTNLNANNITTGSISVGGTSQPSTITIRESTAGGGGTTTARLEWTSSGGTQRGKIWTDASGYMGYNAIGGRHYFYTANNEYAVFQDGSQAIFNTGISCRSNFNVVSSDSRLAGTVYLYGSNNNEYIFGNGGSDTLIGAGTYFYVKIGTYPGSDALRVSSTGVTIYGTGGGGNGSLYLQGSNIIDFKDWTLTMDADKTAIMPTSKGFNALYCVESPEVWFMDFCEEKGKLDPMFEEVTTGPYRYIKCEDGWYQVWGKRKGKEGKRFETKSFEEFKANERFLNMSKPLYN